MASSDTFSKWMLGIAAGASVLYGGWIGDKLVDSAHRLGVLEGRSQCGRAVP